jgi:hypothetical protein
VRLKYLCALLRVLFRSRKLKLSYSESLNVLSAHSEARALCLAQAKSALWSPARIRRQEADRVLSTYPCYFESQDPFPLSGSRRSQLNDRNGSATADTRRHVKVGFAGPLARNRTSCFRPGLAVSRPGSAQRGLSDREENGTAKHAEHAKGGGALQV